MIKAEPAALLILPQTRVTVALEAGSIALTEGPDRVHGHGLLLETEVSLQFQNPARELAFRLAEDMNERPRFDAIHDARLLRPARFVAAASRCPRRTFLREAPRSASPPFHRRT